MLLGPDNENKTNGDYNNDQKKPDSLRHNNDLLSCQKQIKDLKLKSETVDTEISNIIKTPHETHERLFDKIKTEDSELDIHDHLVCN